MDTFVRGTIAPTAEISEGAKLGDGVTVGPFTVIHSGVRLGDNSIVGSHCVLGEPTSDFYSTEKPAIQPCVIGEEAIVRSHAVIYQGVSVGTQLRLGHRVTIREGSKIGNGVQIGTMSDLQGDLTIGNHVRLHSNVHIGALSTVEEFAWIYPFVVMTNDPHPPSDSCTEGALVRSFAVVATNSVLMPGVEVGRHSLVGAMSLVTRDVPAEAVVVGVPAKQVGSVHDVKCRHGVLEQVYPWPIQFRRGYPEGVLPSFEEFGEAP